MDIKQINFSGTKLEGLSVSDITVGQIRDFFEKSDSQIVKEFLNKNKLMDADKKRDGYGYKYTYDTIFYFCFEDESQYMEKYFKKRFYAEGSNRREDVGVTGDLVSSLRKLFKDKRKGIDENNSKDNAEEYKKSRGINEKTTLGEIYYILLNTPDKYKNTKLFEKKMEMIASMIGINDSF